MSGTAIRRTSSGSATILPPWVENITTMVKSRAMSVIGDIFGMNRSWYHSFDFTRRRANRVTNPAINGMPR